MESDRGQPATRGKNQQSLNPIPQSLNHIPLSVEWETELWMVSTLDAAVLYADRACPREALREGIPAS